MLPDCSGFVCGPAVGRGEAARSQPACLGSRDQRRACTDCDAGDVPAGPSTLQCVRCGASHSLWSFGRFLVGFSGSLWFSVVDRWVDRGAQWVFGGVIYFPIRRYPLSQLSVGGRRWRRRGSSGPLPPASGAPRRRFRSRETPSRIALVKAPQQSPTSILAPRMSPGR